MPELHINPENPLIDEKFTVKVTGLIAGQAITIHSSVNEHGARFAAIGCYRADEQGVVDVTKCPSIDGTYTGTEDMGLIWSMKQEPGQEKSMRLIVRDVTKPLTVKISVYNGHLTWDSIYNQIPKTVTSSSIDRWYKAKNVKRIPVRTGQIRGALFIPEGSNKLRFEPPLGYKQWYRFDWCISRLINGVRNSDILYWGRYKNVVSLPAGSSMTDELATYRTGVGIKSVIIVPIGSSMAYKLVTYCTGIKAVVGINGSPYPQVPLKYGSKVIKPPEKGGFDLFSGVLGPEGIVFRDAYSHYDDNDVFKDKNDFRSIAKYGLRIVCPPEKKHKITLVEYPGAGHLLEPPYSPLCRASYVSLYGFTEVWGGQMKEHAIAQEDSWSRILSFFKLNLSQSNTKKSRL
ncbi:hypothetical protein KUTeg_013745 [Tegillarca granosa]|uniref:Uncharacterized protein n=1 Tax=Tegillarca granosa TaxID=220873 RepID=A0ABQ9EUK6_TEGGR|nr:hypothetical protein KUTeg_013745 [Tegillarca granosa]